MFHKPRRNRRKSKNQNKKKSKQSKFQKIKQRSQETNIRKPKRDRSWSESESDSDYQKKEAQSPHEKTFSIATSEEVFTSGQEQQIFYELPQKELTKKEVAVKNGNERFKGNFIRSLDRLSNQEDQNVQTFFEREPREKDVSWDESPNDSFYNDFKLNVDYFNQQENDDAFDSNEDNYSPLQNPNHNSYQKQPFQQHNHQQLPRDKQQKSQNLLQPSHHPVKKHFKFLQQYTFNKTLPHELKYIVKKFPQIFTFKSIFPSLTKDHYLSKNYKSRKQMQKKQFQVIRSFWKHGKMGKVRNMDKAIRQRKRKNFHQTMDMPEKKEEEVINETNNPQEDKKEIPIVFRKLNQHYPERFSWYYIDSNQHIQGPFTGLEMDSWYNDDYFTSDLKIAFDNFTRGNDFIQLGEFLNNPDVFYERSKYMDKYLTIHSEEFIPARKPVFEQFIERVSAEDQEESKQEMEVDQESEIAESEEDLIKDEQEPLLQFPPMNSYPVIPQPVNSQKFPILNYEQLLPFPPMIFPKNMTSTSPLQTQLNMLPLLINQFQQEQKPVGIKLQVVVRKDNKERNL